MVSYDFRAQRHPKMPPTPDPSATVPDQIKFYLDRYKIKEAQAIFVDNHATLVSESEFIWDLIPHICKRLRGLSQFRFKVFEGCEKMLHKISTDENCNPKEVLIILLSEVSQPCDDDNVFKATIRSLEGTLFRIEHPTPRDENLSWVLSVLIKYIHSLELPDETFNDSERVDAMMDAFGRRYNDILPLMLSFIEDFESFNKPFTQFTKSTMPVLTESQIEEVLNKELSEYDSIHEQESDSISHCLINALIKVIERPILYLDCTIKIKDEQVICQEFNLIANRNLRLLLKLKPNLFLPIYSNSNNDLIDISLACCAYLYRCVYKPEDNLVQHIPQILKQEYLLTCHVPSIILLIDRTEPFIHEKGLLLLKSLLDNLQPDAVLSLSEFEVLLTMLFKIMVFSPLKSIRKLSVDLFSQICILLSFESFRFFKTVLEDSEVKKTVLALCIDLYRKNLTNIRTKEEFESLGALEFINLCFKICLDDSQHTDVIEKDDLILSTMSLLRFSQLRHYLSEKMIAQVKSNFLDPIRIAITLVTQELNLLQKNIKIGHKGNNRKQADGFIQRMLEEQNKDMDEGEYLNWAKCRVSLIESVLSRTSETFKV